MLQGGPEAMVQQRRYASGFLEILFSKQNPLIGMFCRKLRFRQSLAYLAILIWSLRSILELLYCLLPAYSLLHNSALFPKEFYLCIIVTVVGMYSLYTLWEFMSLGFSVHSWYASQSFWRMKTTCSWLFSILDIILKLLGVSKTVFIVTKKTILTTKSATGSRPSQREGDCPDSDSGKFEFDGSLYFVPGTFILLVNLAALAGYLMGLQRLSNYGGGGSGLAEACGCILVVVLFLPFLKGLFEKGKYGIPLSTLSKAAFLAVLFVAVSVGK